jgi:hypothetical protein
MLHSPARDRQRLRRSLALGSGSRGSDETLMAAPAFEPKWPGPHRALDAALDAAHKAANRLQRSLSIYEIPRVGFSVRFETKGAPPARPDARLISTVQPDPKKAPKSTWPVVYLFATTDRMIRDVQLLSWREQNTAAARAGVGVENAMKPYKVTPAESTVRLGGFRVPVYTLVVLKNPNFPHDKLAIPLTPVPTTR